MGLVCGAYTRSNLHERCYPLACIWSQPTVTNCNSLIVVCPVHFIALFDSILLLTSLSKTSSKEYMQFRAVAIVDGGTAYCSQSSLCMVLQTLRFAFNSLAARTRDWGITSHHIQKIYLGKFPDFRVKIIDAYQACLVLPPEKLFSTACASYPLSFDPAAMLCSLCPEHF